MEDNNKTLYDKLGGEAAVDAAVTIFYQKVMSDPILVPFFDGVDIEKQAKKQKQFLTYAFGGPNHYTGRGMRNAHKASVEKGLNDTHFDHVMGHLAATLEELNVPQNLIKEAASIAESTRSDVLGK